VTATLTATGADDDGQGDAATDNCPRSQPQTDVAGLRAQNLQTGSRVDICAVTTPKKRAVGSHAGMRKSHGHLEVGVDASA
jgi:hypothetical protein